MLLTLDAYSNNIRILNIFLNASCHERPRKYIEKMAVTDSASILLRNKINRMDAYY